jgi:hypothetical protein
MLVKKQRQIKRCESGKLLFVFREMVRVRLPEYPAAMASSFLHSISRPPCLDFCFREENLLHSLSDFLYTIQNNRFVQICLLLHLVASIETCWWIFILYFRLFCHFYYIFHCNNKQREYFALQRAFYSREVSPAVSRRLIYIDRYENEKKARPLF